MVQPDKCFDDAVILGSEVEQTGVSLRCAGSGAQSERSELAGDRKLAVQHGIRGMARGTASVRDTPQRYRAPGRVGEGRSSGGNLREIRLAKRTRGEWEWAFGRLHRFRQRRQCD